MHDLTGTQTSLDAFADETRSGGSDEHDHDHEDARDVADVEAWPSRWRCPECGYSADYELGASVTPSCPRCLPETFVRMEGQP